MGIISYFRQKVPSEPVQLMFYEVVESETNKKLKPIKDLTTKVQMQVIKAIIDATIGDRFYLQLNEDLVDRGVKEGTKVQLRATFNQLHLEAGPQFKGTMTLCEIKVR